MNENYNDTIPGQSLHRGLDGLDFGADTDHALENEDLTTLFSCGGQCWNYMGLWIITETLEKINMNDTHFGQTVVEHVQIGWLVCQQQKEDEATCEVAHIQRIYRKWREYVPPRNLVVLKTK